MIIPLNNILSIYIKHFFHLIMINKIYNQILPNKKSFYLIPKAPPTDVIGYDMLQSGQEQQNDHQEVVS